MKRMIDNKEFDKLKNDVSNLEIKVDNIETIPSITIDQAQFIDETNAQLTNEQYTIAINNSIINIITPVNSKELAFLKYTNDLATDLGFSGVLAYNSVNNTYDVVNINIDTTTKIATIESKSISSGKQLYQYIINFSNSSHNLSIQFISSEVFNNINDFYTYLENNNFSSTSNLFYFNGGHYNGNCCYCVYNDGNLHFGYFAPNTTQISYILLPITSMTLIKREL